MLDRLEALLKPAARNVPRDYGLIADLLSVPTDGRYPALTVTPQQKREMTLTALLDQLEGTAAKGPVLIVFEDIHWIDPTSLDLLDRVIARIANLAALLVVTFRPESQPSWVGQPHVRTMSLSRLGRRDSADIICGITRDKALPDLVVEQILARTDGVPLFIEELTSTLLESGLLRETADSYVLDGPLPPLAIPTTLQASLVARLDRLGPVKEVAQICAAIGREFSHELISAVASLTSLNLDVALERLTASGLIFRRGAPPAASYSFKHALVRDACYATMLKSRRRQLHESIAKVLVERFPALAESQPELVAHHFAEAALGSEAIGFWVKAGRLASARWANSEAVKFFEQALGVLATLPATPESLEQAIDLRLDLSTSHTPLGEFERSIDYLREAESLARTIDDQRRLAQMSVYMCHNLWVIGHPRDALAFGQRGRRVAESLGDVPLQVTGNLYLGSACLATGDYPQAVDRLLQVLRLLEGDQRRERFGIHGFPAVIARVYLTWALADRGQFDEGIVHGQESLRLAESLDHPYSRACAGWTLAHLQIARGELGDAVRLLERGLALCREWNLLTISVFDSGDLGYAYALSGRMAEGIALLEHAVNSSVTMAFAAIQPLFLVNLGEAYILDDRREDAGEVVRRALTLANEGGQRPYEARALRLLGEVTALRDSPEHAESHYRDALALAVTCGMRPLAAHCHLGLGKLHRRTRMSEQAEEHVAKATTMYRDVGMTRWLAQAEAEMRQLQSSLSDTSTRRPQPQSLSPPCSD
jgi:tetratricopeptide (TPR) repeat protein